MKIEVVFTTQLKSVLEQASATVELPQAATVGDVLAEVRRQFGERLTGLLYDNQFQLLPSILICVNDEQVGGDSTRSLHDGDVVTLLSAISGG